MKELFSLDNLNIQTQQVFALGVSQGKSRKGFALALKTAKENDLSQVVIINQDGLDFYEVRLQFAEHVENAHEYADIEVFSYATNGEPYQMMMDTLAQYAEKAVLFVDGLSPWDDISINDFLSILQSRGILFKQVIVAHQASPKRVLY